MKGDIRKQKTPNVEHRMIQAAASDRRLQLFAFIRVDSWLKCAHQIDEPEDLFR